MGFGNIGIGELMMIFLVIMVVFGPKRMPGIARDMGKFLRDFRRETNAAIKELKDGIEPINVGIFDEPDAASTKVDGPQGNGAAVPLPGVAAAGGAGVITAQAEPLPGNGSPKKAAARKKTTGGRKPARASTSSTTRRKTPASGAARKSSSAATPKKRPAQKAPRGKSSSSARSRTSRKR
jgi:TatA/E family protein of Tat protein translocase